MKTTPLLSAMAVCTALASVTASAQTAALTVFSPAQVAVTQPLRDQHETDVENQKIHYHKPLQPRGNGQQNGSDDALQKNAGPLTNANPGVRFPGVGANGSAPPDTNMAVGPNHIVQTVNSNYAVYNKSGALILGPNSLSSLWSPLGSANGCATNNGGDVVAQYDKLADRWVITQLGGVSSPYSECIAVSQTADPTGAYFLFSYAYSTTLNDYPKFGVWPTTTNSAYLATYNLFANGATFTGGQLCAYDRTKMLAGNATAQGICYTINNDGGFLPSDLDGSAAPLDGTPGYFLNFETLSSLRLYALSPNFANPSASTLTQITPDLAVTAFTQPCNGSGGTCVPQSGTSQQLDSLGDRLMYRLAFRNFGDHEALVVNHSVATGSTVGVRWYELRSPVSNNASFSVYQQATFAPDSNYRWMGSVAMDKSGDIGLGYSASSSSLHPAVRYTGRVPTEALGTMETERSIIEGSGSQTNGLSRWGDYSAMRIDPSDDCTFWYTNEYLQANGSFNWSTAFGSFKFASCGNAPVVGDFSLSASPGSQTVTAGGNTQYTVMMTASGGFTGSVAYSVAGLPAGASGSFNPNPSAASSTPMTVSTSSTTVAGTYPLTITGTSGSLSHTTSATLIVNAAPKPDFSISVSPPSQLVTRGASATYTVTITPVGGFNSTVNFSVSGLPSRTSVNFNPSSVTGGGPSTLTVSTSKKTTTGPFTLTVTGTAGNLTHSSNVSLTVQ